MPLLYHPGRRSEIVEATAGGGLLGNNTRCRFRSMTIGGGGFSLSVLRLNKFSCNHQKKHIPYTANLLHSKQQYCNIS